MGVLCRALAVKPITVPMPQGIPNTATAAILYPGTVAFTSVANDFCQNAVSWIELVLGVGYHWIATHHDDQCQISKFENQPPDNCSL